MKEIEIIQNDIGIFLTDMIPVPWKKICLYAECENGSVSFWFALQEQKTDVITTMEFFWKRYENYPIRERDVRLKLADLVRLLYNSYINKYGEDKKWCTMYYTVESNYSVNIDLGYEMPKGNFVEIHHAVFERFFGAPYKYIDGKYPY